MTKYQIQIKPDSIQQVLDFCGISTADASLEIGATENYLERSMKSGQMSQKYFSAFCETFNVSPSTIQSKRKPKGSIPVSRNSADKVNFDGSYSKQLIYKKGLAPIDNLSRSLGASTGYLSEALRNDFIDQRILNDLAQKLGVTAKELIEGKPPKDDSGQTTKIDPEKIKEVVKNAGLNMDQVSARLGYSHSILDKVIRRGKASQEFLSRFCNEFGVEESDLRLNEDKTTEVQIDSDLCRELIYKNGYTINSASTAIGLAQSSLSASLSTGAISVFRLKSLAQILNVNWESLLKKGDQISDGSEPETALIGNTVNVDLIKAVYNLATSVGSALTSFSQDLLALIEEDTDG